MKGKGKLKRKWLIYAIGGLLLMGFGLSLLGESIIMKSREVEVWKWFLMGTTALVVFFAGLSIFGQAVVFRSFLMDQDPNRKKKRR
jgi:hypothetical protein